MRIMGIDPGAYTGIAVLEDKKIIQIDSINMTKIKNTGFKLQVAKDLLQGLLLTHKPNIVYCEEPYIKFRTASKVMNKLLGIFEYTCFYTNTPIVFINPSVVKKTITGNGKAEKLCLANALIGKVEPKEKILELIGQSKFDETDAIAVALAGYQTGGL